MTCSRCQKSFEAGEPKCPHCGEPNPAVANGVFQTSTVLISSGGADLVYRSVDEVPARLRTKLIKSTNGSNAATILIADRRGRKEIAKAMHKLPGSAQKRLIATILGSATASQALDWLTPARRKAILAAVILIALAIIGLVFTHRWQ
ncbi:MAG TPA: hypothetical protein VGF59_34945 [Bryobacteraceae bacterium]|jgi:hypothetical protein